MAKKTQTQRGERIRENLVPVAKIGYDAWFDAKVGAKQLRKSIKLPLANHMKAYGFFQSGDFEAGLKHYGA